MIKRGVHTVKFGLEAVNQPRTSIVVAAVSHRLKFLAQTGGGGGADVRSGAFEGVGGPGKGGTAVVVGSIPQGSKPGRKIPAECFNCRRQETESVLRAELTQNVKPQRIQGRRYRGGSGDCFGD